MSTLGRHQQAVVDQLVDDWIPGGPCACFLAGFPGTGKSSAVVPDVVRRVDKARRVVHLVTPPRAQGQFRDLVLDLAQALAVEGDERLARDVDAGRDEGRLRSRVLALLGEPVLLVLDEFHHALGPSGGAPDGPVGAFLAAVGRLHGASGRLLLVTNQVPERAAWSDPHRQLQLGAFGVEEGRLLLGRLLADADLEGEIPVERRGDVVQWCGGNPRALTLVVAALAHAPLDELVGLAPEAWQLRDREVSRELVERLERELVGKVRAALDPAASRVLRGLSVHRKPFQADAIGRLMGGDTAEVRARLASSHLLLHEKGWFRLNPVAREVERAALDGDSAARRTAHGAAADHYARHFKAAGLTGGGRLGGHFVEARYHLVQAERTDELRAIARRFEAHVRGTILASNRPPADSAELDERIALLAGLLDDGGAKGLEYHLARCLEARRRPGDLEHARARALVALGPRAPVEVWVLCVRLHGLTGELKAGLELFRRGTRVVRPEKNLFALYRAASVLLATAARPDDALAVLREGIRLVPPDQSLFALYVGATELLARAGRLDELVEVSRDALTRIPTGQSGYKVLQSTAINLLAARDQRRLREILSWDETIDPQSRMLLQAYERACVGDWSAASELATTSATRFPSNLALVSFAAFAQLAVGRPAEARRLVGWLQAHGTVAWLLALVSIAFGDATAARDAWRSFLTDPGVPAPVLTDLLAAWAMPIQLSEPHPAFHYPILPASLTGLAEDLVRPLDGSGVPWLAARTPPPPVPPPPRSVSVPKPAFTWVHLSDIHFGHGDAGHRWNQKLVVDAILTDLRALSDWHAPRPDAVLVTGDVAFSGGGKKSPGGGANTEYADAGTWLKAVAAAVGLGPDRVFVVPGNHDVDRKVHEEDRNVRRLLDQLRDHPEPGSGLDDALGDAGDRELLAKRQRKYLDFATAFAAPCRELHWSTTLGGFPLPIHLVGLNTALLAKDQDRGRLRVGNEQLGTHLLGRDGFVVVLAHHPPSEGWLADQEEVAGWIRRAAHVQLTGHIHEASSESSRSGAGGEVVRISAGAAHGDATGVATGHGYSLASVTPTGDGHAEIRVFPRRWSDKNKDFRLDVDAVPPGADHALHRVRLARP